MAGGEPMGVRSQPAMGLGSLSSPPSMGASPEQSMVGPVMGPATAREMLHDSLGSRREPRPTPAERWRVIWLRIGR